MELLNIYNIHIFERYSDSKKSQKQEYDNNDLWKIFEYYCCICLTKEYNKQFYVYDDIEPNFKELYDMTKNDTGIDCCVLETDYRCMFKKTFFPVFSLN